MEELDERKVKILNAIIQNYMETGEPVGSRTISKSSDLNLSSATIRNEMSDLEELGYIIQPHTSAGRIPSDKGYRFYVDHLIQEKDQEVTEIKDLMLERTEKMEKLLKQVVKVLATNTQYATMISAPAIAGTKVKFVQLSQVNENQVLSVVMMSGNIVKNKLIDVSSPLSNENMLKLNMLLNTHLNGVTVSDINLALISNMKAQASEFADIVEEAGFDRHIVIPKQTEDFSAENDLEVEDAAVPVRFFVEQCVDELSVSKCIREQRIMVDMRHNPDLYLQINCISSAIPQLVRRETQYMLNGHNGFVVTDFERIPVALDYFLGTLSNWNMAKVYSYDISQKFTTKKLLGKWKDVMKVLES